MFDRHLVQAVLASLRRFVAHHVWGSRFALILGLASLCLPWGHAFADDLATKPRGPNIVFILADDLGRGHVGCYGQKLIHTPHIDRLAAEGMKFTQCYAGSHVCAPSRSTLMTGLHTGHTPVRDNGGDRFLHVHDVTIAEILKKAGYVTGGFGKWGLGDIHSPGCAIRQGFDEWFGPYNQVHAHFHYPFFLWKNNQKYLLPANEGRQQKQYAHDEIHAQALDFIRRHKDERFFCYLPYTLPHVELVVPEDSRREYAGKFPKLAIADPRPGYIGSEDANVDFAGMVSRLDRSVGEVLAELKKQGLDDKTLVLFASDNGPQGGAWKAVFVDFFGGAGPFRGTKGSFYEGGIRVPLLTRWPGHIAAGITSDRLCAFWDIMPTLADVAGANSIPPTDGISLLPTLLGEPAKSEHAFLYWEHPRGMSQAVRLGHWKALRSKPEARVELYDLSTDEGEQHDVAQQHPEIVAQCEKIMTREHAPERSYDLRKSEGGVQDFVR